MNMLHTKLLHRISLIHDLSSNMNLFCPLVMMAAARRFFHNWLSFLYCEPDSTAAIGYWPWSVPVKWICPFSCTSGYYRKPAPLFPAVCCRCAVPQAYLSSASSHQLCSQAVPHKTHAPAGTPCQCCVNTSYAMRIPGMLFSELDRQSLYAHRH